MVPVQEGVERSHDFFVFQVEGGDDRSDHSHQAPKVVCGKEGSVLRVKVHVSIDPWKPLDLLKRILELGHLVWFFLFEVVGEDCKQSLEDSLHRSSLRYRFQ